eukprot:366171-Pelagomonas_calceolata.AAC.3
MSPQHDNVVPHSTSIGSKASVASGCVLGEGCVLGDKASIKRSVLGRGCRCGHASYTMTHEGAISLVCWKNA